MLREPIDIELRLTASLAPAVLDEIWAVTERYVDTNRTFYETKLHALPEVGLWRKRGGGLVGLVGLDVYPVEWEGKTSTIIFTSSGVIEERFRGRNLVLRTGLPRYTEIATFMRAPLAKALDGVDIGLIGVPTDLGVTNRPGGSLPHKGARRVLARNVEQR
jgi:hypothetical protein